MKPEKIAKEFLFKHSIEDRIITTKGYLVRLSNILVEYEKDRKLELISMLEANEKKTVKQILEYLKNR